MMVVVVFFRGGVGGIFLSVTDNSPFGWWYCGGFGWGRGGK